MEGFNDPPHSNSRLLSASEELNLARSVAVKAHAGQTDKAGEPYIRHCERVCDAVAGHKAKAVALLHDVLEKGPGWTSARLLECGFSPQVVAAVENLTQRLDETKDALTIRAATHPLSLAVKLADLKDNLAQVEAQGKAAQHTGIDSSSRESRTSRPNTHTR